MGIFAGTNTIENIKINYYYGPIFLEILDNITNISYHSLNNGYMGGYKRIIYTKKCSFYDEDLNTINEEDDEDENEELFGVSVEENKLNKLKESAKSNRIPAGFISDDMKQDMGNLPSLPSLLESQEVGPVEGEVDAPSMEEPSLPPVQEEGVQI